MAHTKALGSTKLGRDSRPKQRGPKVHDGQSITPGRIIVRQCGTKYLPGKNVKRASDDTLYAMKAGTVKYSKKTKTRFDGSRRQATVVTVV